MPAKDYNTYMREYMLARYHARRAHAIIQLGGKCVDCESEEDLEFDHNDPETKLGNISKLWSYSDGRFEKELEKCVLRCSNCHEKKTILEMSVEHGGGLSGKKNCKCELCRSRKNEYMRKWKRNKKATTVP